MNNLNHIEIQRQGKTYLYKGRSNPTAPHPPSRERISHGIKLKQEISDAKKCVFSNRTEVGVKTDKLMVLEFSSEALSSDLLETLLEKFRLSLVEQTKISDNTDKLLIQFESERALQEFDKERMLWQIDDKEDNLLTYAKRRDIFSCISSIRAVNPDDRTGNKLKKALLNNELPNGFFSVNVDVWYNNEPKSILPTESILRSALGTDKRTHLSDLFPISGLLLGRATVNAFSLKALLNLDIVASIELPAKSSYPEPCELYSNSFVPIINGTLTEDAPLAAVLDTGVFSGNRLLSNVIVSEKNFDNTEKTTSDLNGHGTAVAGIVVYGDIPASINTKIFTPLVRICNGKIMHNEVDLLGNNNPVFAEYERPEKIISDAIRFFNKEYGCRVFNISAGIEYDVYNNGRQFAWASVLDQLCRELDIVIVVSAGNNPNPEMPVDITSRNELMESVRDNLFHPQNRIINPATASIVVTVGSISRYSIPIESRGIDNISVGNQDYPSAFTRIGKGINKAIKPEFVAYGGNFSIRQVVRGDNRWNVKDKMLMEPTLANSVEDIFNSYCGTSFAAPYVTHIAARIEKCLEKQLHDKPSANLIRALLSNSAACTDTMVQWGEASTDSNYTGKNNPKHDRMMRMFGYGKVSDKLMYSSKNCVTLFAEDKIAMKDFHLYKIPVPKEFLEVKADKSISISLAYDPVTLLSRKDYLADVLWMEIYKRMDEETLVKYKAKNDDNDDLIEKFKRMPASYKAAFLPGYDAVQNSTLQQRRWFKHKNGGSDLFWEEEETPYIFILISGKSRYKHPEQDNTQNYAVCITFEYGSEEDIQLYDNLKNNVQQKVKENAMLRERTKVKV